MDNTGALSLEIAGVADIDGAENTRRPSIVLSYGLGLDSTAILLRWLTEPETRDFDLADLAIVTAATGNEFASTAKDVEEFILPLIRREGVRFIQCARSARTTTANGDGVVVLDDSTSPQRLYTDGVYSLEDEMLSAGTLPQLGGARRCSVHAKAWALDPVIDRVTGGRPYRHVIGFEAGEQRRADKDRLFIWGQILMFTVVPAEASWPGLA